MYYARILLIFVAYTLKLPEERVVSDKVRLALHDSHGKALPILQVKSFVRSYCVVRVEPYRLLLRTSARWFLAPLTCLTV